MNKNMIEIQIDLNNFFNASIDISCPTNLLQNLFNENDNNENNEFLNLSDEGEQSQLNIEPFGFYNKHYQQCQNNPLHPLPQKNISFKETNINNSKNQIYTQSFSNNYTEQKMTHLRGLVNIASTCYMNSILQCFSHISELSNYFKTAKMNRLAVDNYNKKNKLFPTFQEVIINLWNIWDNAPYYPNNFKERLGEMNPLFRGAYPNDAKDLLTFILLKLHEELNKPNNNNINNHIVNIESQKNKKFMFEIFKKNFINNYNSIFSGLFFGLIYTKITCNFCKSTFYNYQTFNFLIFPLKKVLQYKISLTNNTSNCNNTVTIEDCFKY